VLAWAPKNTDQALCVGMAHQNTDKAQCGGTGAPINVSVMSKNCVVLARWLWAHPQEGQLQVVGSAQCKNHACEQLPGANRCQNPPILSWLGPQLRHHIEFAQW